LPRRSHPDCRAIHGYSGFLVAIVEEAAQNIAVLLRDRALRRNMGRRAQQCVRRRFLMTRLLEDWLDLIASLTLQRPAGSRVQERASAA